MKTSELLAPYVLAACFLLAAFSPVLDHVLSMYADADDRVAFWAMVGTVTGGLFTPIAIIVAFIAHQQAMTDPVERKAKQVNDHLWSSLKPVPGMMTTMLLMVYQSVLKDVESGDDDAYRKAHDLIVPMLRTMRSIGDKLTIHNQDITALPEHLRMKAMDAVNSLSVCDELSDKAASFPALRLVAELTQCELVLCHCLGCLQLLVPPVGEPTLDEISASKFFPALNDARDAVNELPEIASSRFLFPTELYPFNNTARPNS